MRHDEYEEVIPEAVQAEGRFTEEPKIGYAAGAGHAWKMPQDSSVREYQKSIPARGAVPTPDEVILHSAKKAGS